MKVLETLALRCRGLFVCVCVLTVLAACGQQTNEKKEPPDSGKITKKLPPVSAGENFTPAHFVSQFDLQGKSNIDGDQAQVNQVQWAQISGPEGVANIVDPQSLTTAVQVQAFQQTMAEFIFRLTVTDKEGESRSSDVTVKIPKPGIVVESGNDLTVTAGSTIKLRISAYYPENKTIAWTQGTQPGVGDLINADTEEVQFIAPAVAVTTTFNIDVKVSATTAGGEMVQSIATVSVTVNPATTNSPPVVSAGQSHTEATFVSQLMLQGSASAANPGGSITSVQWTQIEGPAATIANPSSLSTAVQIEVFTATTAQFVFRLTVVDNNARVSFSDITITMPKPQLIINAGNDLTVVSGDQVNLHVSVDYPPVSKSIAWVKTSGPLLADASGLDTADVQFTAPQVTASIDIAFEVTVSVPIGSVTETAKDTVTVTVTPTGAQPNQPPVANAGPDQSKVSGDTVALSGSGTDADGTIKAYQWTQVNNGAPTVQLNNSATASAAFTAPTVAQLTVFAFRLTVTDNNDATASDEMTVSVSPLQPGNQPPSVSAGDDQTVYPGDSVTLTANGTDNDGAIAGYLWEQTPTQAAEPTISIVNPQDQSIQFTAPEVTQVESLTFTVTVTDTGGATTSDTVVVSVNPFTTLSGTVSAAAATMTDSDVNDPNLVPVANHPGPGKFQHIPNPVTLGGYVHRAGVGPIGGSNMDPPPSNDMGDAEDVYHVTMAPGQVVNVYLGESYYVNDPTDPGVNGPILTVSLMNEAATKVYDTAKGGTGILSVVAPDAQNAPASATYEVVVLAGGGSAYSYVLTVGSGAPLQSGGMSLRDNFVPGELIVEFNEATDALAPSAVPNATSKSAQNPLTLTQRAASIAMQALGGAPGRSMLMGLGDATSKATAFTTLGVTARPQAATDALQAKLDTILAASALQGRPDIKSVRLNYISYPTAVPNDTLYARQWHYPLINLPQAWDVTTGSSDVTVAVIDTGILTNHPDIDRSRLVDGYDFISSASNAGDGNGIDANPEDVGDGGGVRSSSFHGTHVAGTVGANTNNNIGVAGVAWGVNIMPLRVLGINGGTDYDIEQAIRYAAQLPNDSNTVPAHKADVINLSLGRAANRTTAPQAYRLARDAGVIIVAAAGNDGANQLSAPASYDGVVSVSAVTINKQLASYSNYGATIDVAGPGGAYSDTDGDGLPDAVWSTKGDDSRNTIQYTYNYAAGTSMAAPHVAGVAALMKSVYPGLTPANFDTMLASGDLTQDLGTNGRDNSFGYGLIDAQKAVAAAVAASGGTPVPPAPAVLAITPGTLNFGSQLATIEINLSNSGGGTLTINDISEDSGGWLTISAVNADAQGLGLYAVSVERGTLAQGLYTAVISVVANTGTMEVPVSMQVFPAEVINNAGPQVIELIEVNSRETVQTLRVLPNNGVYDFTFNNVRFGLYNLRASSDLDNDATLCELGESCGAYPTLDNTVSSDISVDGSSFDINGLDFETGFTINLTAQ